MDTIYIYMYREREREIHIYIYTYIHTYICIYIYIYMHVYTYIHMCMCCHRISLTLLAGLFEMSCLDLSYVRCYLRCAAEFVHAKKRRDMKRDGQREREGD